MTEILYFVQNKQRNNYVLAERSPTATTSTPSAPANHQSPADHGKFCLETPTTNMHTIFTVICSL